MKKNPPTKLHGLRVLTVAEAVAEGFISITVDIHAEREAIILASVCQHRNPDRACLTRTATDTYQICRLREDISNLGDPLVGGFAG